MLPLVVGCSAVLSAASAKEAARRCSGAPLPSGAMLEAQLTRTGDASFICALGKHKFCLGAKRVGHLKPSLLRCCGLEGKNREGCLLSICPLALGGPHVSSAQLGSVLWVGVAWRDYAHTALCGADIWRLCTLRKDYSALPA